VSGAHGTRSLPWRRVSGRGTAEGRRSRMPRVAATPPAPRPPFSPLGAPAWSACPSTADQPARVRLRRIVERVDLSLNGTARGWTARWRLSVGALSMDWHCWRRRFAGVADGFPSAGSGQASLPCCRAPPAPALGVTAEEGGAQRGGCRVFWRVLRVSKILRFVRLRLSSLRMTGRRRRLQ
jgi:hypothetical protein